MWEMHTERMNNIYAFLIFFLAWEYFVIQRNPEVFINVWLSSKPPRLLYSLNVFVNAYRFAVIEHVQDVLSVFQLFHRKNNLILDEVSLPLQILHSLLQEQPLMYILSRQHVFLSFEDCKVLDSHQNIFEAFGVDVILIAGFLQRIISLFEQVL